MTFASIYPQGAASARYYSGQYERLAGRRAKAHRWFSQSLAIAQARGERHDEMLAHEALGSVSEGDERDAHLTAWEALREALGNRG